MSFLTTFEADFKKLFSKTPTEIHLALTAITFAAPVIEGILAETNPAVDVLVVPVITRLETGLATAYSLANEGTKSGATLSETLSLFASDLSTLEQVGGIKDPATQAKIATITSEVQAVIALLPSPTAIATLGGALTSSAPAQTPATPASTPAA